MRLPDATSKGDTPKKDFSVFDISETVEQLKAGVSLTDEICSSHAILNSTQFNWYVSPWIHPVIKDQMSTDSPSLTVELKGTWVACRQ